MTSYDTNSGPVRCEVCNTDFNSHADFERHAREDHPPDASARMAMRERVKDEDLES
jgi:hypothetical protein